MRVLVACEFSGRVRDAFLKEGHEAVSCDVLPSEWPGPHIQDDVLNHLHDNWDLMVAFPPCTYLASSGARWWKDRQSEQQLAIEFAQSLFNAPIPRIAIENPVGILSSIIGKPSQIIHPWQFGHGETKATCLWLKDIPPLEPTKIVNGRKPAIHRKSQRWDRWRNRSRTYEGIAKAMASQWG